MSPAIKVENLSKRYQLGLTHAGSIRELVNGAVGRLLGRGSVASAPEVDPSRVSKDGHFWALRDINFKIEPGEVVGIIGRNGAGKSTLLKILSRVTNPTSGRVEMRGRVASLLEVGTGFHPELTGRENVYMNGTILGMTKREIDARLDSIVDFAGVENFIDTPVKRFSSGMTVRLGFAVAAHLEPEILIVDEVLAVGDAEFQKRCMGKLDDVARSGRTVLFVSHNMSAISQLTCQCVVVEDGRTAFIGETAAALDLYLDNSKQKAQGSKSVAHMKRASWSGDQSLRFISAENLTPLVEQNGDIVIRLGMRTSVEATYGIGLTLHGADGQPMAACFEPESHFACGQREWEIVIRNPGLAPGKYWFTLGAVRGSRELIDAIQEVLHFEVSAESTLPAGSTEWNPAWGRIKLVSQHRELTPDSASGNLSTIQHGCEKNG